MFDWIKFVMLGKVLMNRKNEESIRTAISRLYYGVFGVVRRYLINVCQKYYLRKPCGDVHRKVFNELNNSSDSTEREMANILNKLRAMRNRADYDDGDEFSEEYFRDFLADNQKDIGIAIDIVGYFKTHPNY
jgi:uncharacterized protein (UPF0332 family)